MADPIPHAVEALEKEDPVALAHVATRDELERLKAAEELIEARYQRSKRSSRIARISQISVTAVAILGFAANAIQSYFAKHQQQLQAQADQSRWSQEFERAQQADKYRAFFEMSELATDPNNPDKRLVGYALLQEFVKDKNYNNKATLMLEESLARELRNDTSPKGLADGTRNAVVAILTALSVTDDCTELQRAARSIDKVARHHATTQDVDETREVFGVYVRRLVGRAAKVCATMKEFRAVRAPIRDTLVKIPAIAGLKPPVTFAAADAKLAELLVQRCQDELAVSGASECGEILQGYLRLCAKLDRHDQREEQAACQLIQAAPELEASAAVH